MADPLSHATQGSLMLLAPFIARLRSRVRVWALILVGGVLGALPDIISVYGFVILRDRGRLYGSAHYGEIKEILQYIPMYALHLAIDSQTHDPSKEWYGWNVRIWLQVLLWIVNGAVIVWFYRIWKRNRLAE